MIIIILTRQTDLKFLGNYFYALSIISATQILVDYGFNLSALRDFNSLRDNKASIQQKINLFVNIFYAKTIIYTLIACLGMAIESLTEKKLNLSYIFIGFLLSAGSFNWLFYSIRKSFSFSIILFILRLLSLCPLLFWTNLNLALFITFCPVLVTNLILLAMLIKKDHLKFFNKHYLSFKPGPLFINGKNIFVNSIIISLLVTSWPIILSKFVSIELIGIYGIADKVLKAFNSLVSPLQNFMIGLLTKEKLLDTINICYNVKKYWYFGVILVLPFLFLMLPTSLINYVLKTPVNNYRNILNLYAFGFISGLINLILYSAYIVMKRERLYLYGFIITLITVSFTLYLLNKTLSITIPIYFEFLFAFTTLIIFIINYNRNEIKTISS